MYFELTKRIPTLETMMALPYRHEELVEVAYKGAQSSTAHTVYFFQTLMRLYRRRPDVFDGA